MPPAGKENEGELGPQPSMARFLAWFDEDPGGPTAAWGEFREQLIRYFRIKVPNGVPKDPDDWVTELLLRVAKKIDGGDSTIENPRALLMAYARVMVRERRNLGREVQADENFNPPDRRPDVVQQMITRETLQLIRAVLTPEEFELLCQYHADSPRDELAKSRAQLANTLGITPVQLRTKMSEIKNDKILPKLRESKIRGER